MHESLAEVNIDVTMNKLLLTLNNSSEREMKLPFNANTETSSKSYQKFQQFHADFILLRTSLNHKNSSTFSVNAICNETVEKLCRDRVT